MSKLTFNYCGIDAVGDMGLIVNDIVAPILPEVSENTQAVPGMVGKIFLGMSYGQKVFEIEVTIRANNTTELNTKLHELTDVFMTTGDDEYPMTFSTDPGFTYYGHFTNISKPERILRNSSWRKVVLTFACSDPKGYGAYINNDLTVNPASILPLGTSECYPIFTCIPKKNVSKIAVSDEDGDYVFLGSDVDPDTGESLQDLEPRVFTDEANSLTPWTVVGAPTFSTDNASIGGSYRVTSAAITPSSFGFNVINRWHGPLIQRSLPGSYDDFRIRVRMMNRQSYPRSRGKIELYLLNSNGGRIGKIELRDGWDNKNVLLRVQLGNGGATTSTNIYDNVGSVVKRDPKTRTIKVKNGTKVEKVVTVKGKKRTTTSRTVQQWKTVKLSEDYDTSTFSNFYGYIELQKIGNKYRVEILKMKLDSSNPGWSKPIVVNWTDSKNFFSNNSLAGLALLSAKFDIYEDNANPRVPYTNTRLELHHITVNNIINGGNDSTKPEIIARSGDEVKINCEDHRIYKNGRYFMNKLYIGSQFMKMQGGVHRTFAFEPGLDEADWYVEYTPTTS